MFTRIIAFLASASLFLGSTAFAAPSNGKPAVTTSTLDDQQSVSLTIYNTNLGLVKDQRVLDWLRKQRATRIFEYGDVLCGLVLAGDTVDAQVDIDGDAASFEVHNDDRGHTAVVGRARASA